MFTAKVQPNISRGSGEEVDFVTSPFSVLAAILDSFTILKPCSQVMLCGFIKAV